MGDSGGDDKYLIMKMRHLKFMFNPSLESSPIKSESARPYCRFNIIVNRPTNKLS